MTSTAFGFPVVPLEKHKKARFVFASPGASRRSTKVGSLAKPDAMSSSTVAYDDPEGFGPRTTIRSGGMPALCAASCAAARLATWVTRRRASESVV